MNQIKTENISKAIDKIDNLSENGIEEFMTELSLSQHNLIGYTMQAGLEYKNENLNSYLIYYLAVLYQSFIEQGLKIKTITEDDIDAFQESFLLALDAIHKDEDYLPLNELIPQPNLLEFMTREINQEDEDGTVLEEKTGSQLFIVSSAIIGLINLHSSK